jgi:type III restriction enzyme
MDSGAVRAFFDEFEARLELDLPPAINDWDLLAAKERRDIVRAAARALVAIAPGEMKKTHASLLCRHAGEAQTECLPDLLIPQGLDLAQSDKNIYGIVPPRAEQLRRIPDSLAADLARWNGRTVVIGESQPVMIAAVNGRWQINETEAGLIRLLELEDLVLWWHRNPPLEGYSVSLLRSDTKDNFYPDFVLATELRGAPRQQLVETKYDERDIKKKKNRAPSHSYGRVVFVTIEGAELHLVTDEGTIGARIASPRDLIRALRQAAPAAY